MSRSVKRRLKFELDNTPRPLLQGPRSRFRQRNVGLVVALMGRCSCVSEDSDYSGKPGAPGTSMDSQGLSGNRAGKGSAMEVSGERAEERGSDSCSKCGKHFPVVIVGNCHLYWAPTHNDVKVTLP